MRLCRFSVTIGNYVQDDPALAATPSDRLTKPSSGIFPSLSSLISSKRTLMSPRPVDPSTNSGSSLLNHFERAKGRTSPPSVSFGDPVTRGSFRQAQRTWGSGFIHFSAAQCGCFPDRSGRTVRSDGGECNVGLRERVAGTIGAAVLLGIEAGERALVAGGRVVHPALNVTPHCSVSAIITEKGGVQGCDAQTLPALVGK